MNAFLEQKYVEACRDSEMAATKCQKALFDLNVAQKELADLRQSHTQAQGDLAQHTQSLHDYNSALQERDQLIHQTQAEKADIESFAKEMELHISKIETQLQFERECREQDAGRHGDEVRDLQNTIAEYEEEVMNLQNQLYNAKIGATPSKTPSKSVMSDHKSEKKEFLHAFGESPAESSSRIS